MPRPSALGAYIFAGGFSLGVSRYFDVLAHFEDGDFGTATTGLNFPGMPIFRDGISSWPTQEYKGVDFVYSNPPCIGWSSIGRSNKLGPEGWRQDDRVSCTYRVQSLLRSVRPRVWALESVQRLATRGAEVLASITREANELGYHVYHVYHDAKFLGVAQQRRRIFVVASLVDIPWVEPTGAVIPCGDVLKGVLDPGYAEPLREEHASLYSKLGPRGSLSEAWALHYPELELRARAGERRLNRPRFMDHRLNPDLPCTTIVGMQPAVQIHPWEPRYIGNLEAAALCSFPASWKWGPTRKWESETLLEIARGVTPLAGEWLARCVALGLEGGREAPPGLTRVDFGGESVRLADFRMRRSIERVA